MTGKEVQRWADDFMFTAETIDADKGVEVFLLSANPDPLGSVAAAAKAYMGEFVESLAEITDRERRYYLEQIQKTALAMPLEAVNFQFRIRGVTRGFTHQMVRQRTAAYSQESTRFAVKESVPVGRPPSLGGTVSKKQWRAENDHFILDKVRQGDKVEAAWDEFDEKFASDAQRWRMKWDDTVAAIEEAYNKMVNSGMPAEDARGILPTNLLTQINYHSSLRGLVDHAGNRLCTQAQFEWREVWAKMIGAIVDYGKNRTYLRPYQDQPGGPSEEADADWQFRELAKIFRPACYKAGKCVFDADFDRKCSIKDRVTAYHNNGVPSAEWDKGRTDLGIPAIRVQEWAADPAAAR